MKDERNIRLIAGVDLQNCRRLRAIVIAAPAVENVWPPMGFGGPGWCNRNCDKGKNPTTSCVSPCLL